MVQRIVDLSIYLENDVVSDPPGMKPQITYYNHRDTPGQIAAFFPGLNPIESLPPGFHVLCNDRLRAAGFPRCVRLEAAIHAALAESRAWPELSRRLATALADHTRVPLADVAPSHLPPELARELTATCMHTPQYGTRSASLVALEHGRVAAYLQADGPPCTATFIDRMELLT